MLILIIIDWFSKIGNGQVVEILFPEKITHDISESQHFLKFGKKQYGKKSLKNQIC